MMRLGPVLARVPAFWQRLVETPDGGDGVELRIRPMADELRISLLQDDDDGS